MLACYNPFTSFLIIFLLSSNILLAQEPAPKDSMVPPSEIEFKIKEIDTNYVDTTKRISEVPKASKLNTDSLFKRARSLAFKGNRKEARVLCRKILEIKPDYHDVRIFMARTYSWGKLFGKAKPQLYKVLAASPNNIDALNALIDIELWSYAPETALELADQGLAVEPQNEDLLFKKAKAYDMLKEHDNAKAILKQILEINPENEKAKELLTHTINMLIKNSIAATYTYDNFTEFYTPRHLYSLEYKRNMKRITLVGRTNYANRFEKIGLQYEGDMYAKISNDLSGYVNIGYSTSPIFPAFRYGIELNNKLPRGFEASLGYRYLGFSVNKLILYTGSLNKYIYKYWVSFRPYVTPDNIGIGRTYTVMIRRYFKNVNDYATLKLGSGFSPDFINYGTLYEKAYYQKSQNASLNFQKEFKIHYVGSIGVTGNRQEKPFYPGEYLFQYSVELGFKYRF